MYVYVVREGDAYDGSDVVGVFDSEEKAKARIGVIMKDWPKDRDTDDDDTGPHAATYWDDFHFVAWYRHAVQ